MPVILEDEMLLPPSLRRKIERERAMDEMSSVSTIELPPHRMECRVEYERDYERPRSPIVIHQDHYIPTPISEVEVIREREYIVPARQGGSGKRYYRRGRSGSAADSENLQYLRGGRARSVGYDSYSNSDTDIYYLEDEPRGYSMRRHERLENDRHGRHVLEGGLLTAGAYAAGRKHGSPGRAHETRLIGGGSVDGHSNHRPYGHHHLDQHREDSERHRRHLVQAGLGLAAAGATAGGLYKLNHQRRSRSSSSSRSRLRARDHKGRHVAAAALGATAAGLAAHQHAQHHRRPSVSSYSSYSSSDDEGHRHHRGRKVAAGLAGVTAAGLAAKHMHDRQRQRSRSSSFSSSSDESSDNSSHKLRNAALGLGAAGLAAHEAKKHRQHRRRHGSFSPSPDDSSHKLRNAALGVGAAGLAAHEAKKHRQHRRRHGSSSSSSDDSSHKLRNAALGLGAAGLAAHEAHKHQQRARSRSQSRPGILRRRSKTHSPPRHRSSSRGAALAKTAAVTMAGALAKHHIRSRSADASRARRMKKNVHYHHDPRAYNHGGRYVDDGESVSSTSTRPRSRRGSMSGISRNGIISGDGQQRARHGGLAQELAYRVGEGVAEGLRRQRA